MLLEIGTEELPPKSLDRLRLALADTFSAGLDKASLSFKSVKSHATPRRLALIVEDLIDRQPEQHVERKGPAIKAAYDDDGNPSKALQGFMKSCGVSDPAELETLKTEKGEWVMYRASKPGAPLTELLPALLESSLADLPIERRMRWGSSRTEFVRPVHWIVSLYGKDELMINVLGLTSGRASMGHRFMSNGAFNIESANEYVEACRSQKVMVDFDERRNNIRHAILAIAESEQADLEIDENLLDEVTSLVEWPVALKGRFDADFLTVPPEVLISAMKEHQRYFHLTSKETDSLLPVFITVSNIESTDPEVVISGNERVIRPRLSDAAFFFSQDTKTSLDDKAELLSSVVFQTELGSYGDKALRISKLAAFIAKNIGADESAAGRAAFLAKSDLVSDMVGEFPDLQGIMGGYYARHENLSDDVAKGIAQHYRPIQSGGELPDTPVASCVSLADKIDTLTGLFGIDQPPTGSRDPFALRRQSLGVIRICVENRLSLDLADCFEFSAQLFDRPFDTDPACAYVLERLHGYYGDQSITRDVVEAALAGGTTGMNLTIIDGVIKSIQAFRESPFAEQIVAANKRVANLLKKTDAEALPDFDPELATEKAETELHLELGKLELADATDIQGKLQRLARLQQPVDRFFDEVLVMSDDDRLKNNRLALLAQLRQRFLEVADFSLLQ
ncbi:MAG: glycine--tRNA ligase subunit beta [Gammaproteobacteria bacterium]|nr:glycine--tRNA ligase subunit beta [Gammaproteobacteria bacterium]MBT7371450.1 glycine--tRNA ligase subunit beta [Gammaproteobacteria bacterium]